MPSGTAPASVAADPPALWRAVRYRGVRVLQFFQVPGSQVVNPRMQLKRATRARVLHDRYLLQVAELRHGAEFDHAIQPRAIIRNLFELRRMPEVQRSQLLEPLVNHAGSAPFHGVGHATAVVVATDDDVPHVQDGDAVLEARPSLPEGRFSEGCRVQWPWPESVVGTIGSNNRMTGRSTKLTWPHERLEDVMAAMPHIADNVRPTQWSR